MSTATNQKSMELEGNLSAFALPDVLRFLAMGKLTGTLTLINGHRIVELTIKEGQLVGTGSAERFLKLGQLLVYSGFMSRKELEDVLDDQSEGETALPLGELLIERKVVTAEQVREALTLQLKEEMWELFSWVEGSFKFEHGTTPSMRCGLVSMDIDSLVEESAQHMAQWRAISSAMEDADQVFIANSSVDRMPDERLKPNTWRILSLINGRNTVQNLIYLSALGRFETLCAIEDLFKMDLIQKVKTTPNAASEPQPEGKGPTKARPQSESAGQPPESKGGLRGLFGRRRSEESAATAQETGAPPAAASETTGKRQYKTSVAWACRLINQLAEHLCAQPAIGAEYRPDQVLEEFWKGEGMRYPRADLIRLRGGRLDGSEYDRYVDYTGGVESTLTGCQEDAMEALAAVGRNMAALAHDKLGNRASTVIEEATHPFVKKNKIAYPVDFLPRSWVAQWMEEAK